MIKLVTGRKKSGKTQYIIDDLKRVLSSDKEAKALLIVPGDLTFVFEKMLATSLSEYAPRLETLSCDRLAWRYIDKSEHRFKTYISPAGKTMLVYKILTDLKSKLDVFSASCDKSGFCDSIVSLIGEFCRYSVTPDDIKNVPCPKDSLLEKKLNEIYMIYSSYLDSFKDGSADSANNLTLLADLIEKNGLMGYTHFYFDAFNAFTPSELKVLYALKKQNAQICITLCYDGRDNGEIFYRQAKSIKEITDIADGAIEKVNLDKTYITNDELSHLEKSIFTYPVNVYDKKCEDISLFRAKDIFAECENIAYTISNLVKNEGYRWRDITVAVGDMASYAPILEKTFKQYGIAFFTDNKDTMSNHPITVMISNVLAIITNNFRYENVFAYLKTGFGNFGDDETYEFENFVLKCGIKGNIWTDEDKWAKHLSYLNTDDEDYLGRINSYRTKFLDPILKLKSAIKERSNIKDMCVALTSFLNDIGAYETLLGHIEKLKQSGDFVTMSEYKQVWNAVCDLLSQLVSLTGDVNVGVERFGDILSSGFNCYTISVIPTTNDSVSITGANRLKATKTRAMFIAGALEGAFPLTTEPDSIIGDEDRRFMIENGVSVMSDSKTQTLEERFRVYNILTHAKDKLYLSYPVATIDGKATAPSMLITQITDIFPNIKEPQGVFGSASSLIDTIVTPHQAFDRALEAAITASTRPDEVSEDWAGVFEWYYSSSDWQSVFSKTLNLASVTNNEENIDKTLVSKLYGDVIKGSATRLETFASCPFSYFMQYALKAKERETFELKPVDTGNVFHTVIEHFTAILKEEGIAWHDLTDEKTESLCRQILDDVVENSYFGGLFGENRYKSFKNRLYRIIKRSVMTVKNHITSGCFEPCGVEVTFGTNGDLDPITYTLPTGETILITGKIDRVDEALIKGERFARIIDYKSSDHDINLNEVISGINIQLALYINAYCDKTGAKPAGMLYFKFDDPMIDDITASDDELNNKILNEGKMTGYVLDDSDVLEAMDSKNAGNIVPAKLNKDGTVSKSSKVLSADAFKNLRNELENVIRQMGSEIYNGNVAISPVYLSKDDTGCKFCPYKDVCKFDPTCPGNSYRKVLQA